MLDLLLQRYNDIDFIFSLDVDDFIDLVDKAFEENIKKAEENRDELLLHRWGYELPFMEKKLQFNEYRSLALGEKTGKSRSYNSDETNEELIERMNKIKERDQKKSS